MQVRVRRKNPLIERHVTELTQDAAATAISEPLAIGGSADARHGAAGGAVIARATVPVSAQPLSMLAETSDTTKEFAQEEHRAPEKNEGRPLEPARPEPEPMRSGPAPARQTPNLGPPDDAQAEQRASDAAARLRAARRPARSEPPELPRRAAEHEPPRGARRSEPPTSSRAEPPEILRTGDHPRPRAAALLDEDKTEIADGPPSRLHPVPSLPARGAARSAQPATVHRVRDRPQPGEDVAPKPQLAPDSVPRELLGKWGTDAVGAAHQRAQIARLDLAMPEVHSPLLKSLRGELSREEITSLERCLAGELDDDRTEASLSPKRSLEHLINEHAFNELSSVERAKLLRSVAPEPRDIATVKSAIAILKTGIVRRLRSDERDKLFEVFIALDSETRALLARTAARPLRGRSALEDHDFEDVGLVQRLYELLKVRPVCPQVERLGMRRTRVLMLLLGSLANPERLPFEEGGDGVLGMFEYALADCSPAELTRLWGALIADSMAVTLAGGERLDLGDRIRSPREGAGRLAFSSKDTPLRLGLELLVELAHPRGRPDRTGFVMPGGHGVDADVISRALSETYGVGFTVAAGAPMALRHLERVSKDTHRVPPVFVTLLYDRGERLFLFDHFEGEEVILRAPHGRSTKRRGNERADPPRVVEDPDLGLDRISLDDLKSWIGVALVPRSPAT